jgi:nondiscriminating glutamyl-tRNA synthetase
VQGSVQDIMQTLDWVGIRPKEGPSTKEQPYGPYVQSERLHIYKRYLDEMRQRDMVYPCFCTPERLEKLAA